jgi:hypothetical protein
MPPVSNSRERILYEFGSEVEIYKMEAFLQYLQRTVLTISQLSAPKTSRTKPLSTTTTSNTSPSQYPLSHPKCNSPHFSYPHWQCSLYPQHQLSETAMGVEAVTVMEVVTAMEVATAMEAVMAMEALTAMEAVEAVAPASLYIYPTHLQPSPKILTSCLHLQSNCPQQQIPMCCNQELPTTNTGTQNIGLLSILPIPIILQIPQLLDLGCSLEGIFGTGSCNDEAACCTINGVSQLFSPQGVTIFVLEVS